ncbi:unnamed protein product [Vicia faba]|uniref:ATP-dependent DNA helicase n=1 Tax=Vicia faba TaxID=3906 RepID=A0AAV0ZJ72_VICFA|nr:unnamed protein product [Vicia faba]
MYPITEASQVASGNQLRKLFVMLLYMDSMTNPYVVWDATWKLACSGILYDARKRLKNSGLQIADDEFKNLCLIEIEKLFSSKDEYGESTIQILYDLLVPHSNNPLLSLVEVMYPLLLQNMNNLKYYEERRLISPTHDAVDVVNDFVLSLIPDGEGNPCTKTINVMYNEVFDNL